MVVETSRPIAEVARELGINETSLGNWMRAYREKHAGDEPPLQISERARLRELVARMAAHLRRARLENAEAMRSRLEFRDLVIDVNERRTYKSGKEVELTHTEFDLLTFLASNAGKVLSREKILNSIWGYEYPIETRVIDVHIRNLRRKIETQPSRPYYILAVPGIGYRFTNARPS